VFGSIPVSAVTETDLTCVTGSHHEAARLFGAAGAARQRMGTVRYKSLDADHETQVAMLQDAMGQAGF
jgi:hypothetical protein